MIFLHLQLRKQFSDDDFTEVQPYMKGTVLSNTRMSFRVRCKMVNDVRGNFKSKYIRNGGEAALFCDNCDQQQIETQSHCLVCSKWKGIRQGLDVTTIDGLTTFFQRLLMERAKEKTGSQGATQQDSCSQLVTV